MVDCWFDIKKIAHEVYAIYDSDYSTMYLINGAKKSLLIDSGFGLSNIKEFVKKHSRNKVELITTHGHPDHIGGSSDFSEFYISKHDINIAKKCYSLKNKKWAIENVIRESPKNFSESKWIEKNLNKIIPIDDDGYEFDLGDRIIEIIYTPGHSKGCVTLLDKVSRCIFTGDMVFDGVWLHLEESESIEVYQESLQKIKNKELKFDYIFPGHGNKNLDKNLLNDLIEISNDINKKRITGKKVKTLVGEGIKYSNNNCKIIGKIV